MVEPSGISEIINLLLCAAVFLFGYIVYRREEKIAAFLIGIAFGVFGLSHLSVIAGISFQQVTYLLLRVCGYILVAAALWILYTDGADNGD